MKPRAPLSSPLGPTASDAPFRLVVAAAFVVAALCAPTPRLLALPILLSVLLLVAEGQAKAAARRLLIFIPPFLLLASSLLGAPGEVLFRWGPLTITRPGTARFVLVAAKGVTAFVLWSWALLGRENQLLPALYLLGLPQKLLAVLLFARLSMHRIARMYREMVTAYKVRVSAWKPRLGVNLQAYAGALITLFLRSLQVGQNTQTAVALLGFDGDLAPLLLPERLAPQVSRPVVAMALATGLFVVGLILEVGG